MDSNYTTFGNVHSWRLPINLEEKQVGLSSFYIDIEKKSKYPDYIYVKCNLIERAMHNQDGVLLITPFKTTSHIQPVRARQIGLSICLSR